MDRGCRPARVRSSRIAPNIGVLHCAGRAMPDPDQSPISVQLKRRICSAQWKAAPALVLAVSGGPGFLALMWLAARWRRALSRGPRLIAVTVDHGLRPGGRARGARRQASRSMRSMCPTMHAALDRRQAEDRPAGRGPRRALSAAGEQQRGRAAPRTYLTAAYPRRSGRDAVDADACAAAVIADLAAMARETEREGLCWRGRYSTFRNLGSWRRWAGRRSRFADDPGPIGDLRLHAAPRLRAWMPALVEESGDSRSLARLATRLARANRRH